MISLTESLNTKKAFLFATGYPQLRTLISASKNIRRTQLRILQTLLLQSGDTVFGRAHHFSQIRSMADYCKAVPISGYHDYEAAIDRMCRGEQNILFPGKPLFYTNAKFNGRQKLLPVSEQFLTTAIKNFNYLWLYSTLHDNSTLFNGKFVATLAPAIEGFVNDGTPFGSLAGAAFKVMPKSVQSLNAIPYPIYSIRNLPARLYAMMRCALAENVSWIVATHPRMLMQFHHTVINNKEQLIRDIHNGTLKTDIAGELDPAERISVLKCLSANPNRSRQLSSIFASNDNELLPRHYWPNLTCITAWKNGDCAQDMIRLTGHFSKQTTFREFGYQTNEVRAGIVLSNNWTYSVLPAHWYLFEFIEVGYRNRTRPPVVPAHELELGKSYYIIVTNGSGLYRYDTGDIIRISGFYNEFPLVEFLQRGRGCTNCTGEQISEQQILSAFEEAVKETGLLPPFYTTFCDTRTCRYKLYAEFTPATSNSQKHIFTVAFETHLRYCNKNYANACDTKRLHPIELIELRQNAATFFNERLIDGKQSAAGVHSLKFLHDDVNLMLEYDRLALNDAS